MIGGGTAAAHVRFLSVSALERADVTRDGGCLRKWWYRYVAGIREEQRRATDTGKEVHAQIAEYLTTARDVLGPIARTARHLLPRPGDDLEVEAPLCPSPTDPAQGVLRLAGVPLIGSIDLRHRRGVHVGGFELTDAVDPPGTVEVCDHKTTSRPEFAATPDKLRRSIQMVGYGEQSRLIYPDTEWLRLSHHVIRTDRREPARKVTVRLPVVEIADTWRSFEPLARDILDTARIPRADDVPANTSACAAFGGCQYATICTASRRKQLGRLFGTGAPTMSLLDDLLPEDATAPAARSAPPPPMPAGFAQACRVIDAGVERFGWPTLAGAAALARAYVCDLPLDNGQIAGTGRLAVRTLTDPTMVVQLAGELERAGVKAPPLVEAPAPAASPPPAAPPAAPAAPAVDLAASIGLLPPDAPIPAARAPEAPAAAAAPPPPAQPEAPAAAAPEAPAKRRGRPPKSAAAPAGAVTPTPSAAAPEVVILVNASTAGAESLDAEVAAWARQIATEAGVPDIRCATDSGHPLAYGRWRGVLARVAADQLATLPPGYYTIDGSSDFAGVVVEAAHGVTGVRVVRGR